jgi:pentose-5-phosphate-3-epimerase
MKTCPSFPEHQVENYFHQINRLSPFFQYFQIDFADGILVNDKTASVDDFISTLKQKDPASFKGLVFDIHLMVKDYESEIKKLETIKDLITIKNVLVHYSVVNNFTFDVMNFSSFSVGLVLNPEDTVEKLSGDFNLEKIPSIQIMTVIPGAQGRPFIPDALKKIEQLRMLDYRSEIFLDGAVNDKTLPLINSLKFKPDVICPGSYLTKCNDDDLQSRRDYLLKFA